MKKMLFGIVCLITSGNSFATSDYSKTVGQLGVQGITPAQAYFTVKEGLTLTCQYGDIYVDLTTDFGRAAYAELLAARTQGRILSRIDYTQSGGPGSQCTLLLVEVQD